MYLILNTAMSSTWGFPQPCPEDCSCKCFDCTSKDYQCTCGMSPGFCKTLPASFLVDYVRVYQFPNASSQKVGCSTPDRPTKKWIEGHLGDYMDPWDDQPLLPVQARPIVPFACVDCQTKQKNKKKENVTHTHTHTHAKE